jgi:hypothetical protein
MADERTVATRILDLYERGEPTRRIVSQLSLEGVVMPDGRPVRRAIVDVVINQYEREVEHQANPHEDDAFDSWVDDEAEGYGIGTDHQDAVADMADVAADQPDGTSADPDDDEEFDDDDEDDDDEDE